MYLSPNHPDYGKPPARPAWNPPEPTGRELVALERPGRGRGPDAELRVSIDEYQGHAYLSVRLWERGEGGFYPTKKGVSVRLAEADDVAAALIEGARLANATPARLTREAPAQAARHQHPRRPGTTPRTIPAATSAAPSGFDPDFDEFGN